MKCEDHTVETRGFEPLTPALQSRSRLSTDVRRRPLSQPVLLIDSMLVHLHPGLSAGWATRLATPALAEPARVTQRARARGTRGLRQKRHVGGPPTSAGSIRRASASMLVRQRPPVLLSAVAVEVRVIVWSWNYSMSAGAPSALSRKAARSSRSCCL